MLTNNSAMAQSGSPLCFLCILCTCMAQGAAWYTFVASWYSTGGIARKKRSNGWAKPGKKWANMDVNNAGIQIYLIKCFMRENAFNMFVVWVGHCIVNSETTSNWGAHCVMAYVAKSWFIQHCVPFFVKHGSLARLNMAEMLVRATCGFCFSFNPLVEKSDIYFKTDFLAV